MNLRFDGVLAKRPQPGVTTRRLDFEHMTVTEYTFEPGAVFPIHSHAEEQLVVMLAGLGRFTVGDQEVPLAAGESAVAGPFVPHGCTAGPQGCRFLNILSPRRVGEGQIHYRATI